MITIQFKKHSDKKHSVRFAAIGDNPAIRDIYVSRDVPNVGSWSTCKITLEGDSKVDEALANL